MQLAKKIFDSKDIIFYNKTYIPLNNNYLNQFNQINY